jgi:broad specificity phosphatase PhoE
MIWYFLRHAEKERLDFQNSHTRSLSQPLSDKGRQSAQQLPVIFAEKSITAIYISSYLRTLETIAPVAGSLHLVPIVDERLDEIDNGQVGDMTEPEFGWAFPEEYKAYKGRRQDFRYPGGETGAEAQKRMIDFVTEKLSQHPGQNILVVSHDGLIRLWMCYLLGLPVFRRGGFQVDLCGLTELDYLEDEQRWKLIRFNQVVG